MPNDSPLEFDEQCVFVQWLELKHIRFTAIPNDTYTKSWKQKAKKKAEGVRAGFPDLVVVISPEQSIDGLGKFLAIEMKRVKGGVVSESQKEWIQALGEADVIAHICKGADEAIELVGGYLK